MPIQNELGRGKQEMLNDNAVKTADYVIRMNQICIWWKYALSFHIQFYQVLLHAGSGCNYTA